MLLSILCQISNSEGLGGFNTSFNFDIFLRSQDLFITPIYFIIIIALCSFYSNQRYHNQPIKKYFLPALIAKMMGAICVGLIYQYYYNGAGDTRAYYGDGKVIGDLIWSNPSLFFKVLSSNGGWSDASIILPQTGQILYFHDPNSFMVDKIVACIGLFTFQTYTTIAIVLATISFFGVWSMYITFCKIYPNLYKEFAIATLFIPSVVFWGSGILKDCITLGCLGWFTYSTYNILFIRRKIFLSIVLLILSGYFIYTIKPYIIFSFLPGLILWFFLTYRSKVSNPVLRNFITPFFILIMIVGGYQIVKKLGEDVAAYSFKGFVKKASSFQIWHTYLADNNGASGYNLGTIDPSPLGVLKKFPAAVNVTLFRPYLWEAHNPVIFLSALESFILFAFTLRIFFRTGIIRTIKTILSNPTVTFCIFFTLLFAFATGFTAYNFGALVRYKIPCIPFYVYALFILDYITKQNKIKRQGVLFKHKKSILFDSRPSYGQKVKPI